MSALAIVVPEDGRAFEPEVRLVGEDGNAWAIMGRVSHAMREAGASREFLEAYRREATSGDYDHLLRATLAYLEACGWYENGGDDD